MGGRACQGPASPCAVRCGEGRGAAWGVGPGGVLRSGLGWLSTGMSTVPTRFAAR